MRILLLLALSYLYLLADAHIFLYHRFGDDRYPTTNTSVEELRKEFEYFKQNNYHVVPLETILDKIEKKEKIPDNWIALTIDDAYKSFLENGLPLFKEYNYPFTLFTQVAGRSFKHSSIMHWGQLKELLPFGKVELHSFAHDHMTHLSDEEVISSTKKAIRLFEKNMGYSPTLYAYPYGEYDDRVKTILKDQFKFRALFNQDNGSVNHKSDIFNINRIALVGEVDIEKKLQYKTLHNVEWIEPKMYPEGSILTNVKARVKKELKTVNLFVSGHGWREINVNNGIIDAKLNLELKNDRTRVAISTDYYTISIKLLIKNK